MDKLALTLLLFSCLACAASSGLSLHDYDVQIHPIHAHDGYHHGGYATSIRYDKRYPHKVPDLHHHDDLVYQYVAEDHHHDDDDVHGFFGY